MPKNQPYKPKSTHLLWWEWNHYSLVLTRVCLEYTQKSYLVDLLTLVSFIDLEETMDGRATVSETNVLYAYLKKEITEVFVEISILFVF